jgi:hypothetical protein
MHYIYKTVLSFKNKNMIHFKKQYYNIHICIETAIYNRYVYIYMYIYI